jgi:hypothetical protein
VAHSRSACASGCSKMAFDTIDKVARCDAKKLACAWPEFSEWYDTLTDAQKVGLNSPGHALRTHAARHEWRAPALRSGLGVAAWLWRTRSATAAGCFVRAECRRAAQMAAGLATLDVLAPMNRLKWVRESVKMGAALYYLRFLDQTLPRRRERGRNSGRIGIQRDRAILAGPGGSHGCSTLFT